MDFNDLNGITIQNGTVVPYYIQQVVVENRFINGRLNKSMELRLNDKLEKPEIEIIVRFYHTSGKLLSDQTQLTGLAIENVRVSQMENINFHVYDYEEGSFDFYCESIEVVSS